MSYHTGRADSTNPERFIVDLGASIPVSLIRYISNAGEGKAENFSISVANNGDFSDRVTLMSLTDNINIEGRNKLLPVGGYYRYVLIEGNTAAQDISVSEIEIFADASCVQSSEVFEVSAGLSAMDYQKSGSSPGTASDLTTAGNIITYMSQKSAASNGHSAYVLIDLGAEYYIEDFGIMTSNHLDFAWTATENMSVVQNFRANLKFFGLRELPDTTGKTAYGTYVTYQQAFANAIISDGVPSVLTGSVSSDTSGFCIFGLSDAAKAQRYRYVGVIKSPATYEDGTAFCDGQLCLKQLKVYASMDRNSDLSLNVFNEFSGISEAGSNF